MWKSLKDCGQCRGSLGESLGNYLLVVQNRIWYHVGLYWKASLKAKTTTYKLQLVGSYVTIKHIEENIYLQKQ